MDDALAVPLANLTKENAKRAEAPSAQITVLVVPLCECQSEAVRVERAAGDPQGAHATTR